MAIGPANVRKRTLGLVVSTTNLVSGRFEYRAAPKIQVEVDLGVGATVGLRLSLLGRLDRGGSLHGMAKIGGLITGQGAYTVATVTGSYRWLSINGMTYHLGLGAGVAAGTFYNGPFTEICAQIGKSF